MQYEQFVAISAGQTLKAILVTGGSDMRSQAIALAQRPHLVGHRSLPLAL